MAGKKVTKTIRIPEQLLHHLESIAHKRGVSFNQTIVTAAELGSSKDFDGVTVIEDNQVDHAILIRPPSRLRQQKGEKNQDKLILAQ